MKREEEEEALWLGVSLNEKVVGVVQESEEAKDRLQGRTRGLMHSYREQVHQRHNQLNIVKSIQLIRDD